MHTYIICVKRFNWYYVSSIKKSMSITNSNTHSHTHIYTHTYMHTCTHHLREEVQLVPRIVHKEEHEHHEQREHDSKLGKAPHSPVDAVCVYVHVDFGVASV